LAAPPLGESNEVLACSINSEHLAQLEEDLKVIFEHPSFENIEDCNPLAISAAQSNAGQQTGHKSIYKQAEFDASMMETGPELGCQCALCCLRYVLHLCS